MYRSLKAFRTDALKCGADGYRDDSLKPHKLEAAYRIYKQTCAGTKLKDLDGNSVDFGVTIVGRLALREDNGTWIPADEAFPCIDEIMQQNLKTLVGIRKTMTHRDRRFCPRVVGRGEIGRKRASGKRRVGVQDREVLRKELQETRISDNFPLLCSRVLGCLWLHFSQTKHRSSRLELVVDSPR
jgi:hypothetical protein